MGRPEVLEIVDVHPGTTARLEQDYVLHKLWEAAEPKALIERAAPEVRAVVTNGMVGVKADVIRALPKLEIIGVFGVGVDAVDVAAARERGIRVTNTPDVLTTAVAELGVALLLDVARKVTTNDRFVRTGRWPKEGDPPLSRSLVGKRIGILGLGKIGQALAARLEPFGVEISYHGPSGRKPDLPYAYVDDLLALAREVDCLIATCVGGPATKGVVSREVIEALGPEGWLINVSRGSVVDEPALIEALVSGRLGGAGLDVFANEPEVPNALIELENVVLQPHQGSGTEETRGGMGKLVLDNLAAHFAGRPLVTPVA
jgi:lactate dehydrogenase-like 2-hydroxyacid dehydrogenase